MSPNMKKLTDFLVQLGIEQVEHTNKTYLAHLIAVYRFMESNGCDAVLCGAGMFHSIYGTERFQGFKLTLDQRPVVRDLIGERAEHLAYLNCAMDRASFDRSLDQSDGSFRLVNRLTGEEIVLSSSDFDDLCRVHLFDWLEQVPRSRLGWGYRRTAYRRMAERLGGTALAAYDRVFAQEPAGSGTTGLGS
jgi:hypothetical protein